MNEKGELDEQDFARIKESFLRGEFNAPGQSGSTEKEERRKLLKNFYPKIREDQLENALDERLP